MAIVTYPAVSSEFAVNMGSRWSIGYSNGREMWKKKKVHRHKEKRKDKKVYSYRSRSIHQRSRSSTRLPEWSRKLALVVRRSRRSPSPSLWHRSRTATTDYFSRVRPHKMMVEPSRYDKWDRDRGGGGGSGGGGGGGGSGGGSGAGGAWSSRDRERDRERERQARAHQMSHAHAAEPDASSLFPAPVRVSGHRDKVSQQIQHKLGDYYLAQTFIDDPSKSIGICAEPPSPAPCRESRRESEFKKPAHAPQNGRVHHRPYALNKSDGASSASAPAHRPPPIRIPNGLQTQNANESSKPPIESILKEMKSLPTPLSGIAATPRKELENKFIFNPYTNKVQENPQLSNNDLKSTLPKAGLDNRISNSRRSVSPDRVNKDLGLSESDDEVAAATHRIGPPLSPIGSGSPTSGSSSPSDTDTDSSSAGSTAPPPPVVAAAPVAAPLPVTAAPPTAVLEPAQRSSWGLVNFAPPPPQPLDQSYDSGKELRHALADVKGKPQSPISELSDSEASSPSPGSSRRRTNTHRTSTASSDDDTPSHHTSSRAAPKRGRPIKTRASEERPAKKRRGRPPKPRAPSPPAPPAPDSDPDDAPLPPPALPLQDVKTHIFRKVFTPKKGDEGGGKGGKGGKGKGGKGKGQVTIIEITAPEPDDDERRRSAERRNEEALARVSPLPEPEPLPRRREVNERIQDRLSIERAEHRRSDDRHDRPPSRDRADRSLEKIPTERTSNDRIATERTSNDRIQGMSSDRSRDRTPIDRLSVDRAERMAIDRRSTERSSSDRTSDRSSISDRSMSDRLSVSGHSTDRRSTERVSGDKLSLDRLPTEKISHERIAMEKLARERLEKLTHERLENKLSIGRIPDTKMLIDRHADSKISIDMVPDKMIDRLSDSKMSIDRIPDNKLSIDKMSIGRMTDNKMSIDQLSESKMAIDRLDSKLPLVDRYVRAEADVGSGLKPGRGSERSEDPTSIAGVRRSRVMVRVPLTRLRPTTLRGLQRPRRAPPPPPAPTAPRQSGEVAPTNHERTAPCEGQTPIYYSYFERLPADALSDEERDHKYYLEEATRLRTAADREQEPLTRVMLYLESVLCFVLTGRVLELELDTKGAFTIYRETIEYIKLIHSMPQRFRASPHDTFNKLDILSLRVQALLYLRMFKMYNREVKEYNKIVHDYQQKPACAESASPLSPTPSPAGSVGSVGSGASASSGYCSLVHSVPAHAHQALLLLTKYYMFLYVAHDLWDQADGLCRLPPNQDLFIAVDRKCGPLSLSSTFRHLVQYVRHAITLLKSAPRE